MSLGVGSEFNVGLRITSALVDHVGLDAVQPRKVKLYENIITKSVAHKTLFVHNYKHGTRAKLLGYTRQIQRNGNYNQVN